MLPGAGAPVRKKAATEAFVSAQLQLLYQYEVQFKLSRGARSTRVLRES